MAISDFTIGQKITGNASVRSSKTTPPPIYTEGDAIDVMKNIGKLAQLSSEEMKSLKAKDAEGLAGIGTARTRGPTVSSLEEKSLISFKGAKRQIIPTEKGLLFYDLVKVHATQLTSPSMTAKWEHQLSMIENGELSLDEFTHSQEVAMVEIFNTIMHAESKVAQRPLVKPIEGDGKPCAKCGKPMRTMVINKGEHKGKSFLGCSGYPTCTHAEFERPKLKPIEGDGKPCAKCGKPMRTMVINKGDNKGKFFLGCSGYPDCKNAEFERPVIEQIKGHGDPCPKCGKPMRTMVATKGDNKGKSFLGCSGYPDCKHTMKGT
jgi:DNA topoisomerase-3